MPNPQQRLDPLVNGGGGAITVGVASAQIIGINNQRWRLIIHNPSASAVIYICPASFGPAVVNGSGCLTINAGAQLILDNTRACGAFNAIASAAATPITIWEF